MSRGVQRNPVEVSVGPCEESAIEQKLYEVPAGQRLVPSPGCSATTNRAPAWCSATPSAPATTWPITWPPKGFSALALNIGDLEQRRQDRVLVRFANSSATCLVATDVAARGLDIRAGAVIS